VNAFTDVTRDARLVAERRGPLHETPRPEVLARLAMSGRPRRWASGTSPSRPCSTRIWSRASSRGTTANSSGRSARSSGRRDRWAVTDRRGPRKEHSAPAVTNGPHEVGHDHAPSPDTDTAPHRGRHHGPRPRTRTALTRARPRPLTRDGTAGRDGTGARRRVPAARPRSDDASRRVRLFHRRCPPGPRSV